MTQQAFLLSYIKYGDHDAVLHCFCKESGYTSFFAKGIYAPKNKKKAFLFPINEIQMQVSDRKKSIQNVLKIEQTGKTGFTSDIRKNTILFFAADLLNQILRNENQNQEIYQEITIFLDHLKGDNFHSHLVLTFLLIKRLGLQPLFSDNQFLNPETGTFEALESHRDFGREVSAVWKFLLLSPDAYGIQMDRSMRQNFLNSVMIYLHYHLSDFREPKSLEVIKEIF